MKPEDVDANPIVARFMEALEEAFIKELERIADVEDHDDRTVELVGICAAMLYATVFHATCMRLLFEEHSEHASEAGERISQASEQAAGNAWRDDQFTDGLLMGWGEA